MSFSNLTTLRGMNIHSAVSEMKDTQDARSEKHEKILDAALALFGERGFHGTAVPLIAEQAGVGAGTIYRYFESKEALVNVLYKRWKRKLGAFVLEGFPWDAPVRAQFSYFWGRMAAFVRAHGDAYAFLERHHHAPYLDDESRAAEVEVLTPAKTFFEVAAAQRIVKAVQPEVLIAMVFGAFKGLVEASWAGFIELTEPLLAEAEACIWEAVRA